MSKSAPKAARKHVRRKRRTERCSVCESHGSETFWFLRKRFIFDVDLARKLTQDGRKSIRLVRDDVRYAVESSVINEDHVPHVDVRFPGIMARVRYIEPNGKIVTGDVLIDGHHRAARCIQLRRSFHVYVLNYDETDRVLTRRPDSRRLRRLSAKKRPARSAPDVAKKQRRRVARQRRGSATGGR